MASAYVPPPPQDSAYWEPSQLEKSSWLGGKSQGFGGEGFEGSSHYALQQVPDTPALSRHQSQRVAPHTLDHRLDFSFDAGGGREHVSLRSVDEIPAETYRLVFSSFEYFNLVQSKVFDDVMYTDRALVTSAPTGSGKTVIFELAIIRLLMQTAEQMSSTKIVYVAPIKALCSERFEDWSSKFGRLGLRCCELTGDSQLDDYFELQNSQIIMTTPEKWDSMTRKWRDHKSLVQLVRLFLIDEVHQLNDAARGPTMEAIVSRMKTISSAHSWGQGDSPGSRRLRFLAISATMPNSDDVAAWLGTDELPALQYCIDESHRPVRLRRVVLSYPNASTEFKFDLSLNYRVSSVIQCYSEQKPTLVFCATRKGTQQAASTLVKDARFVMNSMHKQRLQQSACSLRDSKLRELVVFGVGFHHAGVDASDRKLIEALFTAGDLPVLFATSTLAMGVNLPAHLVVIKSTLHYVAGMFQEYSESQVLQMIGRAGRPQFDTTATAVIMTRNSTKAKYEALLNGTQVIESHLHRNLIEHLNAEVVLHTISDLSVALQWIKSTFLYIRAQHNPKHYGMPDDQLKLEEELQELCLKDLNMLEANSLVKMQDDFILQPTETGKLMARYCVAFESMKRLLALRGSEELGELVGVLAQCKEFEDVRLRVSEKRVLNSLNKDKHRATIRFPLDGKIKSTDMKVNCLIQAALSCLPVQEFGLNQDTQKIFRAASRLSKCYFELQMLGSNFKGLLNAILLHKCIQARLWENSKYVSKQLDKIGLTLSTTLVNAGLTTFAKLQESNPRQVELIMNRHPPFGNQVHDAVAKLPQYQLTVEQLSEHAGSQAELLVSVLLSNHAHLREAGSTTGHTHYCMLVVGDMDNRLLCKQRCNDSQLLTSGRLTRRVTVHRAVGGDEVKVHLISLDYVGLDVEEVYSVNYKYGRKPLVVAPPIVKSATPTTSRKKAPNKACSHRCINKAVCGHECCKFGLVPRDTPSSKVYGGAVRPEPTAASNISSTPVPTPKKLFNSAKQRGSSNSLGGFCSELQARSSQLPLPSTPALRAACQVNLEPTGLVKSGVSLQSKFSYTPQKAKMVPPSQHRSRDPSPAEVPSLLSQFDDLDDFELADFDIANEFLESAVRSEQYTGNKPQARYKKSTTTAQYEDVSTSSAQRPTSYSAARHSIDPGNASRTPLSLRQPNLPQAPPTGILAGQKRVIDELLECSSPPAAKRSADENATRPKHHTTLVLKKAPSQVLPTTATQLPRKAAVTMRTPQPAPSTSLCSFFTAGPVDLPSEEDGDMFAAVFAGIF